MSNLHTRIAMTTHKARKSLIVSPDDFRMDDGKYVHHAEEQKPIWDASYALLKELISQPDHHTLRVMVGLPGAGKSTWICANKAQGVVTFDATMARRKSRKQILQFARQYGHSDLLLCAVFVNTPLVDCRARNALRSQDRCVPDEVLTRMHLSLSQAPPSLSEGWDQLVTV